MASKMMKSDKQSFALLSSKRTKAYSKSRADEAFALPSFPESSPSPKPGLLTPADIKVDTGHRVKPNVEKLKQTMLEHEAMFKEQLKELHRLYKVQRSLMAEVGTKVPVANAAFNLHSAKTSLQTGVQDRHTHAPGNSRVGIDQINQGFTKLKPAQALVHVNKSLETAQHVEKGVHTSPQKRLRRTFDLEQPGELYMDIEVEDKTSTNKDAPYSQFNLQHEVSGACLSIADTCRGDSYKEIYDLSQKKGHMSSEQSGAPFPEQVFSAGKFPGGLVGWNSESDKRTSSLQGSIFNENGRQWTESQYYLPSGSSYLPFQEPWTPPVSVPSGYKLTSDSSLPSKMLPLFPTKQDPDIVSDHVARVGQVHVNAKNHPEDGLLAMGSVARLFSTSSNLKLSHQLDRHIQNCIPTSFPTSSGKSESPMSSVNIVNVATDGVAQMLPAGWTSNSVAVHPPISQPFLQQKDVPKCVSQGKSSSAAPQGHFLVDDLNASPFPDSDIKGSACGVHADIKSLMSNSSLTQHSPTGDVRLELGHNSPRTRIFEKDFACLSLKDGFNVAASFSEVTGDLERSVLPVMDDRFHLRSSLSESEAMPGDFEQNKDLASLPDLLKSTIVSPSNVQESQSVQAMVSNPHIETLGKESNCRKDHSSSSMTILQLQNTIVYNSLDALEGKRPREIPDEGTFREPESYSNGVGLAASTIVNSDTSGSNKEQVNLAAGVKLKHGDVDSSFGLGHMNSGVITNKGSDSVISESRDSFPQAPGNTCQSHDVGFSGLQSENVVEAFSSNVKSDGGSGKNSEPVVPLMDCCQKESGLVPVVHSSTGLELSPLDVSTSETTKKADCKLSCDERMDEKDCEVHTDERQDDAGGEVHMDEDLAVDILLDLASDLGDVIPHKNVEKPVKQRNSDALFNTGIRQNNSDNQKQQGIDEHHKEVQSMRLLDPFEAAVLMIKPEELVCETVDLESLQDEGESQPSSTFNKGRSRRGRMAREFQREMLPSIISLSRQELNEDLQKISAVLKQVNESSSPNHKDGCPSKVTPGPTKTRGRARCSPNGVTKVSKTEDQSDPVRFCSWGESRRRGMRRTRGQLLPTSVGASSPGK